MELDFSQSETYQNRVLVLDACRTMRTFVPSEVATRTGLNLNLVRDAIACMRRCFKLGSVDNQGEQCYFVSSNTETILDFEMRNLQTRQV